MNKEQDNQRVITRFDINNKKLTLDDFITFSYFGKYHKIESENKTKCHIDFEWKDFRISSGEHKEFGVCKKCVK